MLRLLMLCVCIALLISCAKPGKVGLTAEIYEQEIKELQSKIYKLTEESNGYRDLYYGKQEEIDNNFQNENEIYGQFDMCSSLMGEMLSYARTHKWLSKTDQERIKFISSIHSSAFNYDKGLMYYNDQKENPEEYEDGEDDYEQ